MMKFFLRLQQGVLLLLGIFGLAGCSSMKIEDFAGKEPRFIPEQYFLGTGKAHGVFFDRFGNLKKSFVLILEGRQEGEVFIIAEDLRYDDGRRVEREYRLRKMGPHTYEVASEAFDGPGEIRSYGNALNWSYTLKEEIGGEIWHLHFNDWMFLQEDGVVLNRAFAKKFGLGVGEVFLTFRKDAPESVGE